MSEQNWLRQHKGSIVAFVIACVIGLAFEHAQSLAEKALGAEAIYQRIVTRWSIEPIPRFTALITIREGQEPQEVTLVNVCEQRHFLAKLITTVAAAGPDAIVLDKYFKDTACDLTPSGTVALQDALSDIEHRRPQIPVIVGRQIEDSGALMPSVRFQQSNVTEGEVSLDEDERRVPLMWPITDGHGGNAGTINTLSLAAALAHTPHLFTEDRRVASFYSAAGTSSDNNPYAGLLPRAAYDPCKFAAIKVVCGESATASTDWRHCATPDAAIGNVLRGRIVLIGEDSGLDSHVSSIGKVPGVLLQANYIEAILSGALYKPIPSVYTYVYGAVVFILIKVLIKFRPKLSVLWIVAGGLMWYGVTLALAQFGLYLNPGVGMIALVVGQVAEHLRTEVERVGDKKEERSHGTN